MNNKRKYRHELKFIINKNMVPVLKQRLEKIMEIDKNSTNNDNSYNIRSIYFDNHKNNAYYEKLDGVLYRKKYRIRIYNNSKKMIRLECKYKHNNMTSKDQTKITYNLAQKLIKGEIDDLLLSNETKENYYHDKTDSVVITENTILRSFLKDIKINKLKPVIIVDYKRTAFTYPISDIRVTFDEEIKSGLFSNDLFNKDIQTFDIWDNKTVVLEVKFNEIMPESIAIILSTIPTFRQAVSKFAICRSII